MGHFWLNMNFINPNIPVITLTKNEIDKVCKDKKNIYFDPDFKVELIFEVKKACKKEKRPLSKVDIGQINRPDHLKEFDKL